MFKKIWTYWLQHFVLLWLLINLFNAIDYAYKLSIWGALTLNADGTPITAWQMFIIHNFQRTDYLYLAGLTFLVELNYRYTFKKHSLALFITGAVVIGGLCIFMMFYFSTNGSSYKYPSNFFGPVVIIIGYSLVYALLREFFYQRLYKLQVRADLLNTQLNNLTQQLNPHFLFNTLNYLYGTALLENAQNTANGIDMMAEMMRYTVTGVQQTFVPLNDEVSFIKSYLQLQQLRMATASNLTVLADIDVPESNLRIAPLLLLPFIENAFKFGISTDHDARINLSIKLDTGKLTANFSNTIIPGRDNVKGTGNGIVSSKRRLALLYPDTHNLIISTTDKEYRALLVLDLKHF